MLEGEKKYKKYIKNTEALSFLMLENKKLKQTKTKQKTEALRISNFATFWWSFSSHSAAGAAVKRLIPLSIPLSS